MASQARIQAMAKHFRRSVTEESIFNESEDSDMIKPFFGKPRKVKTLLDRLRSDKDISEEDRHIFAEMIYDLF